MGISWELKKLQVLDNQKKKYFGDARKKELRAWETVESLVDDIRKIIFAAAGDNWSRLKLQHSLKVDLI